MVVRVTKLVGQQEHGHGADISKSQTCSLSRSGDMEVLVNSCCAEMHSRHGSAVPLIAGELATFSARVKAIETRLKDRQ